MGYVKQGPHRMGQGMRKPCVAVTESQSGNGGRILHFLPGLKIFAVLICFGKPLKCHSNGLEAEPIAEVGSLSRCIAIQ